MTGMLIGQVVLALRLFQAAQPPASGDAAPAGTKVEVTVDYSETPELREWAEAAGDLTREWYPTLTKLLKSEDFTPPTHVWITLKKDMKGVAGTSRDRIAIAADWVRKHPEDTGMVIHELTHVVQSYPPSRAGWLVEGIADYIRFFHYEPETKVVIRKPETSSYRDGYRTTAKFLAWIESKHDRQIVKELNAALRKKTYTAELFETRTGRSLDDLWREFIESLRE